MWSNNEDIFYDILEYEYMQWLPYYKELEEIILSSFEKEELKTEIEYQKEMLRAEKVCYKLKYEGLRVDLWELDEIWEYFVHELCRFFYGAKVEELEKYIKTLEYYFRRHHVKFVPNSKYKKPPIDISQIPIVDVISRYMDVKWWTRRNIRCWFHRDIHPSFRIYPDTNSWYCFSCSRWWNAITFVALMENISNKEAYKMLQEIYS